MTILCYHAVQPNWISPIAVPPNEFQRHCVWLSRHRRVAPLTSAAELMGRTGKLPKRMTALSFDDGFRNIYDNAWPVVLRHQLPVTVFIVAETLAPNGHPVDWVDPPRPKTLETLSLEEVLEMQESGVRFESHGYSHRDLTAIDERECEKELRDSRELLEDLLASPVTSIAYPRGLVNSSVRRTASRAGYEFGFSLCNRRQPIDSLQIPRAGIYRGDGLAALRMKSSRLFGTVCGNRVVHGTNRVLRNLRDRSRN